MVLVLQVVDDTCFASRLGKLLMNSRVAHFVIQHGEVCVKRLRNGLLGR